MLYFILLFYVILYYPMIPHETGNHLGRSDEASLLTCRDYDPYCVSHCYYYFYGCCCGYCCCSYYCYCHSSYRCFESYGYCYCHFYRTMIVILVRNYHEHYDCCHGSSYCFINTVIVVFSQFYTVITNNFGHTRTCLKLK